MNTLIAQKLAENDWTFKSPGPEMQTPQSLKYNPVPLHSIGTGIFLYELFAFERILDLLTLLEQPGSARTLFESRTDLLSRRRRI